MSFPRFPRRLAKLFTLSSDKPPTTLGTGTYERLQEASEATYDGKSSGENNIEPTGDVDTGSDDVDDKAFCSVIKSRDIDDQLPIPGVDPLIAAIYRNATRSPLCRLPDHMLLDIMHLLDLTTLCQLRRVSRTFMRLFASDTFIRYHEKSKGYRFLWPSPFQAPGGKNALLFGKETKSFCESCATNRRAGSKAYYRAISPLYCSGCERDHPSSIFSAAERRKGPAERICIGREGHIRLCEHRVFKWDEFVWVSSSKSDAYSRIVCGHRDHKARVAMVERPSSEVEALFIRSARTPRPWADDVRLSRTTHLSFPLYKRGSLVTADDMRKRLSELRERSLHLWYAERGPRSNDPMACFDPNLCTCLNYEGSELLPAQTKLAKMKPARAIPLGNECTHDHRSNRWVKDESGYLAADFRVCRRHSRCFEYIHGRHLSARRRGDSQTLEPWSPQWYLALDPLSHKLTQDLEFKGVTWCEDSGCRNYYRYREHASPGTVCRPDRE